MSMAKETAQMNKNTVIKYLKYSRGIDDEIKIKRNIVEDLEMCYDTSAAINYDGMPKGQNHISNPTEKAAMNIPNYVRKEIREYKEDIDYIFYSTPQIFEEIMALRHSLLTFKQVGCHCFLFIISLPLYYVYELPL